MFEEHSLSTYVVGRRKDNIVEPLGTAFLVEETLVTLIKITFC